jgi:hypothetical protein
MMKTLITEIALVCAAVPGAGGLADAQQQQSSFSQQHPALLPSNTVTLTLAKDGVYKLVHVDRDTGEEAGKVEFVNRPYPRVKPGSVLVKTEIAAVCVDDRMYTDHIHEWFDHPLYGVGHEGVGTVVEAPESSVFRPGDKVLISHGGIVAVVSRA